MASIRTNILTLVFYFQCRAIQASLVIYQKKDPSEATDEDSPDRDSELYMALLLSQKEQEEIREKEEQQRLQDEKILDEILQLSLTEK